MSMLRQRLIDDLMVRNYSPRTVEAYVAAVVKFTRHFKLSPDLAGSEDIRQFQVDLLVRVPKPSWSQFNQIVAGLRFFFGITLGRPEMVEMLPYGKKPKTLPCVLSIEEVVQLLQAARPGREHALLATAYACGLRISELLHLQVTDIDSKRMVIIVRQGKGQKDRLVPMSPRLLDELRRWWCYHRTKNGAVGQRRHDNCVGGGTRGGGELSRVRQHTPGVSRTTASDSDVGPFRQSLAERSQGGALRRQFLTDCTRGVGKTWPRRRPVRGARRGPIWPFFPGTTTPFQVVAGEGRGKKPLTPTSRRA